MAQRSTQAWGNADALHADRRRTQMTLWKGSSARIKKLRKAKKMIVTTTTVSNGMVARGMYTAPMPLTVNGCDRSSTPQSMYFHPGKTSAVPAIADAAQKAQ